MARLAAASALTACSSTPVEPAPPTVSISATTSPAVAPSAPDPAASRSSETLDVEALRGGWRSASNPPAFVSYRFDGARYTTDGYPPWQESGRIELLSSEGRRLQVRFVERIYDGKADADEERWIELAADGRSFVMAGRTYQRLDHDAAVATDPPEPEDAGSAGGGGGELSSAVRQ